MPETVIQGGDSGVSEKKKEKKNSKHIPRSLLPSSKFMGKKPKNGKATNLLSNIYILSLASNY